MDLNEKKGYTQMETLKQKLKDWTDLDIAAYTLALNIGLMNYDTKFETDAKHVFWSQNLIGDVLYNFLFKLVDLKILELQDDEKVRWNVNFKGSWEIVQFLAKEHGSSLCPKEK